MKTTVILTALCAAVYANDRVSRNGQRCDPSSPCPEPFLCVDTGTCQPVQTTVSGGCRMVPGQPSTDNCVSGLVCVGIGASTTEGSCQVIAARGQFCFDNSVSAKNVCEFETACVDAYCQKTAAIGAVCKIVPDKEVSIVCEPGALCDADENGDGVCIASGYTDCTSESDCTETTTCAEMKCRPKAAPGGECLEQPEETDQVWCDANQVCLDVGGGTSKCFDDACYGVCGAGTTCDNDKGACQKDTECLRQPTSCCTPLFNVAESSCAQSVQDCVCAFDDKCCNTVLDIEDPYNTPGWDVQCVAEARKYCYVPCEGIMDVSWIR